MQSGSDRVLHVRNAPSPAATSSLAVGRVKVATLIVGKVYGTAPYGLALPKNGGLDKPMLAALKKLMSDGTYASILKKWGIQAGAIKNPTINGATS